MNEKFIEKLQISGLNMRQLSQASGVPYTVINELVNQKKDINHRSAETVLRIANALTVKEEEILNPIHVMNRFHGQYAGIPYVWEYHEGMLLRFTENNNEHIVQTGYQFTHFQDKPVYKAIGEMIIQSFLDQKQADAEMDDMIHRIKETHRD